jgi:hypothetical protein
MDEIGERLSARGPFMKICPLAAEGIRRNHTLGLELVVAHRTPKLYLTQRCHWLLLLSLSGREREYLCHDFDFCLETSALLRLWVDCIFSHRKNCDRLPTRELVVDAHQPTA